MTLWDWLHNIDQQFFSLINSEGALPAIDFLLLMLRNAITWVPLYAFMLFWIIRYHRKQAWQFILLSVATFAITDYGSASILKPLFSRDRPCYDAELIPTMRTLVGCGGRNSFPSSHAANHFGIATFWFWAVFLLNGQKWRWLFVWALLIGYAQVYVGKHYPLDIVGGALFGWPVGIIMAKIFERWSPRSGKHPVSTFATPT